MKRSFYLIHRIHMYLALFCLPWFVMYGITAAAFNHRDWFDPGRDLYDTAGAAWTEKGSWPCTLAPPSEARIPRAFAKKLLDVAGISEDAYGAFSLNPNQIEVYFPAFWETRRLTYRVNEQRLSLHERKPVLRDTLTGFHTRAGYHHDGLINDAWAIMVDLVALGFVFWVFSGMFIWWIQPNLRRLGGFSLLAGILSFVAFLVLL